MTMSSNIRAVWLLVIAGLSAFCGNTAMAQSGSPIVDLRNSSAGHKLTDMMKQMGQGNEGDGGVDTLTLNRHTGDVSGHVWVRHRQVAGHTPSIYNPFSGHREGGDPIVVYDLTQKADFGYNARTGQGRFVMDLGRGVKVDTRRIQRMLDGDLGAWLENIPNPNVVIKKFRNEYEQIRNSYYERYGKDNVYFASNRFVDWASPETAGNWVITAIATGGSAAVAQAMRQSEQQASLEANDIIFWLERKGVNEARGVVQQILSGNRVDWPFLAVKWQTIGYFSSNFVAGQQIGPEIRSTHAAFVLIWQGQQAGPQGGPGLNTFETRLLNVSNNTGEPIEVWLQYFSGGRWYPTAPGPNSQHLIYRLAPGESEYFRDGTRNNMPIDASEMCIRAISQTRQWNQHWERSVPLVQPNNEGRRIYQSQQIGTHKYNFN